MLIHIVKQPSEKALSGMRAQAIRASLYKSAKREMLTLSGKAKVVFALIALKARLMGNKTLGELSGK